MLVTTIYQIVQETCKEAEKQTDRKMISIRMIFQLNSRILFSSSNILCRTTEVYWNALRQLNILIWFTANRYVWYDVTFDSVVIDRRRICFTDRRLTNVEYWFQNFLTIQLMHFFFFFFKIAMNQNCIAFLRI